MSKSENNHCISGRNRNSLIDLKAFLLISNQIFWDVITIPSLSPSRLYIFSFGTHFVQIATIHPHKTLSDNLHTAPFKTPFLLPWTFREGEKDALNGVLQGSPLTQSLQSPTEQKCIVSRFVHFGEIHIRKNEKNMIHRLK